MKKVSVIIPTFNVENKIDRCLESLTSQTYSNMEIIICDDCSSDGTWVKLKKWEKKDARIQILKNDTNSFAAVTRNRCIQAATGEYIALQDADDYSALDRIQTEVQHLEEHLEFDFVCSTLVCFDENGIWYKIHFKEFPEKKDFIWGISFTHASAMFRTHALKAVGGYRVARETRRGEDLDLFMRLYANGSKGVNISDDLYFYNEDRNAYKRRKYRYRICEAVIRHKGYKALHLYPMGILGVIKPLVIGLIPNSLHKSIKSMIFKREKIDEKN